MNSIRFLIGSQCSSSRMAAEIPLNFAMFQNQARGRIQHGLKPVEKIRGGFVKKAVAVINSTCDEGMNQRA